MTIDGRRRIVIFALKDIAAEEEVRYDYNVRVCGQRHHTVVVKGSLVSVACGSSRLKTLPSRALAAPSPAKAA